MTSPTERPANPDEAALVDAIAAEHATIYGYGFVSAHSTPDVNDLVSEAMAEHRERREAAIALLTARSVQAPIAEPGYRLPMPVDTPDDAARLAIRMESDDAVAWRAVLEQARSADDRRFALEALTQCAALAARWRKELGDWPLTTSFPGGSE